MSITVLYSLFNYLGFQFTAAVVHPLQRFGVHSLFTLELLCTYAVVRSWSTIVACSGVTFYALWMISARFSATYQVKQIAVKHARGVAEYNLRRSREVEREAHQQETRKIKEAREAERESYKRSTINLHHDIGQKHRIIAERDQSIKVLEKDYNGALSHIDHLEDEAVKNRAEAREWKRKAKLAKEDADAREVSHKTERSLDAFVIDDKDNQIADLDTQLRTAKSQVERAQAEAQQAKEQLQLVEQRSRRYKSERQVALQSARDAETSAADSQEQLRVAQDKNTRLLSRAETAEERARVSEHTAAGAQITIIKLQDDVTAGAEREKNLKSELAQHETALQIVGARVEGLQADLAGYEVAADGLRAEVSFHKGIVDQSSAEHAEYRDSVEVLMSSYEDVFHRFETKLEEKDLEFELLRKHAAAHTFNEGSLALRLTDTSPALPSSAPASPAESGDESDTPSLTFCDSDAVIDDGPKSFADAFVPTQHSTPASARQTAVCYTLTTSTSAEIVSSDTGSALIVTSISALSLASHFAPTRHSTPKRPRSSQRPRLTTTGFLQKVEVCEMELPLRPAVAHKTSAVRPCDAPDLFSPTYRGIDTRRQTRSGRRFVRFLLGLPGSLRDACEPALPHPAGHLAARGRIQYNRTMNFAQSPTARR